MNVDEARGRLIKVALYMQADQQVDESRPDTLRAQLKLVFHNHADKPVMVQRAIGALLDEIVVEQIPGYEQPVVQVFQKCVRETLESVAFLTTEGFEEAAWFRASDAIQMTGLYLDCLLLTQREPVKADA